MARILIVEDDRQVLALERRVVGTLPGDHEVMEASNVYDALSWIKARTPDLIILDCLLGKATTGNGFMVYFTHMVRAGSTPDIPIVLISGMPRRQLDGLQAAYSSIKAVYQKPFDIMDVRLALIKLLSLSCDRDEALAS